MIVLKLIKIFAKNKFNCERIKRAKIFNVSNNV